MERNPSRVHSFVEESSMNVQFRVHSKGDFIIPFFFLIIVKERESCRNFPVKFVKFKCNETRDIRHRQKSSAI